MNLGNLCHILGVKNTTFATMKFYSKDKFDFIFSFDKDIFISYKKYMQYVDTIFADVEKIYYLYDVQSDFGRFVMSVGATKNSTNAGKVAADIERLIFTQKDYLGLPLKTLKRLEKICEKS